MNILHVVPTFYPATYWGGPIFSLFGLCNALGGKAEIDLRILTTDAAGPRLSEQVKVSSFPMRYAPGYDVYMTRRRWGSEVSPRLLSLLGPMVRWADVVHITGTYSFPVIPALFLCRIWRKPLVWSPRGALQRWAGTSHRAAKWAWERLCNRLLVEGRCVLHVTSEAEGRMSAIRIPRAPIACIPNGIELPQLENGRQWRPGGEFRLLFIGRLDPIKGIENLLRALKTPMAENARLSICGSGAKDYEDKLRQLVATLALGARVRFLGHVDRPEKSRVFFESDACILPSFSENFGMVVLEALAHGIPVIASRGTPWAGLERQGCGLWVDNSPAGLAEAIQQIERADLDIMGTRGRQWMEKDYGWTSIADRMFEVYKEITRS